MVMEGRIFNHRDIPVKHIEENQPGRIRWLRAIHIDIESGGSDQVRMRWESVWRQVGNCQFHIEQVSKQRRGACSQHEGQE